MELLNELVALDEGAECLDPSDFQKLGSEVKAVTGRKVGSQSFTREFYAAQKDFRDRAERDKKKRGRRR